MTEELRLRIQAAREKTFMLYEGKQVAHRSCGIALAETFNRATPAYQSLRRGGITGCGECGAVKAGELILGEILGDPDPAGPVTDELRSAMQLFQRRITERVDRGDSPDLVCNHLTAQHGDFLGERRKAFCTNLAAIVSETVAEVLAECDRLPEITPIPRADADGGSR